MSVKMKFGSKDIPFVYKGDKLIYPNPIKDGLLLWYDFKGMRNTDTNKEVAKDLSLNGNDGALTNFNFTEESGYKDNTLVFDGVDDSLTIPELELDETVMTVIYDGKTYAYEDDKVVTVGEDGSIEARGRNLASKSSFTESYRDGEYGWHLKPNINSGVLISSTNEGLDKVSLIGGEEYTISWDATYEVVTQEIISMRIAYNTESGSTTSLVYVAPVYESIEGVRLSQTFTAPISSEYMFQLYNRGNNAHVKNLKIEKGTVANDWTPAPEDFQTTSLSPSSLSNLQLYNRTLHKNELLHNAESKGLKKLKPGVVVQDGLVLHYDFSHESNTSEYKGKAFDYSGNGNHGELQNFAYAEGSGYQDGGLKFDGVDDEIRLQNSWEDTGKITVETVFDSPAGNTTILGASHSNFEIATFGTGTLVFYYSDGIASNYRQTQLTLGFTKTNLITTIFHKDLDSVEVFVNGVKRHSYTNPNPQNMTGFNGNSFIIGSRQRARFFAGEMFSSRIYKRALTDEEIQHNYEVEKANFGLQ